jgi:hypothetical protein
MNDEVTRTLPIKTVYYGDRRAKQIVRINHALTAFKAVPLVVMHMQTNDYEAVLAEVFDLSNGDLHAIISRKINGELLTVFKREVHKGE